MFSGGKYGKWEVLQNTTIVGMKSYAGIAAEDAENRALSMTMTNYHVNVHSSALRDHACSFPTTDR